MCSKADTNAIGRLLRCGHRRLFFTLNVIGPQVRKLRTNKGWTQNQLALKLQLFGWDTSRESVTRLENQSRRVPDLELFVVCQDFGRQSRRPVPAQPARQGQRACAALSRQTLTRPGSADGLKFTVQSIFQLLAKIIAVQIPRIKKYPQRQSRKDLQLLICEET